MINVDKFDEYLNERNETIDNAAYNLICALTEMPNGEETPWSKKKISTVTFAVEQALEQMGMHICNPFYYSEDGTDENPCPIEGACNTPNCPFKENK